MKDKRDKAYTEAEEKKAVKFVDKVIKAENDDLQKIFWIMKGMRQALLLQEYLRVAQKRKQELWSQEQATRDYSGKE